MMDGLCFLFKVGFVGFFLRDIHILRYFIFLNMKNDG